MRRIIGKTVGSALAVVCLAATLAMAQGQTMTCTASDGKGNCTTALRPDGKSMVVTGIGVQVGEKMTCEDRGYMINCEPVWTK